jgi:chromate transporter
LMSDVAQEASFSKSSAIFLRLGVTSFGGPIAHLGYFRAEFVERRKWLTEQSFVDLVALSQFLPGPASSQVGFGIGLSRAGYLGGIVAWAGFTLPSALLLFMFACGATGIAQAPLGAGIIHGLKLVAVAIVAQAVLGMSQSLCPDRQRASIAALALILVALFPGATGQVAAIILGGVVGLLVCRANILSTDQCPAIDISPRVGFVCLFVFFGLLAFSFLPIPAGLIALFNAFYRSGALVFGGGHVMLPLLRDAVVAPGWVTDNAFLAGYGATQAIPGPLFTIAAYLGAIANITSGGAIGSAVATIGIFLPGMLVLLGVLPFWFAVQRQPIARAAMLGINAAVVGILGFALYNPVWTTAVNNAADFAIVAAAFVLLIAWRASPLIVVICAACAGAALSLSFG